MSDAGEDTATPPDQLAELQARFEALQIEHAELRGRLSAQTETKPAEAAPVKEWTRAELDEQVNLGRITEAQRDGLLEQQNERRLTMLAEAKAAEAVNVKTMARRLDAELTEFEKHKPEGFRRGSPDHRKLEQIFNRLVGEEGLPKTKGTELAALRELYGPIERLRAATQVGEGKRETHAETGGSGGSAGAKAGGNQPPKNLTPRQRGFYEYEIAQGRYKDWGAVAAMLDRAEQRRAAR